MQEALKTRLLAVVLAMVMLFGILPVQAFAATAPDDGYSAVAEETTELAPEASITDLSLVLVNDTARGFAVGREIKLDDDDAKTDIWTKGAGIEIKWFADAAEVTSSGVVATDTEDEFVLDQMIKNKLSWATSYNPSGTASYDKNITAAIYVYGDAAGTTLVDEYRTSGTGKLPMPLNNGLGIVGSELRGGSVNLGAGPWTASWMYGDGTALRPASALGSNNLQNATLVATATDLGRTVYLRVTDNSATPVTYETEKVTIKASDFEEFFDFKAAELYVDTPVTSSMLSWGIQGFNNTDNQYPLKGTNNWAVDYTFTWMKSADNVVSADDTAVPGGSVSGTGPSITIPAGPTPAAADIGSFYYAKLEATNLRKAVYTTDPLPVVAARPALQPGSMYVGNAAAYTFINNANDVPSTWTDISYKYYSTTASGVPGTVVQEGVANWPRNLTENDNWYFYTDSDVGKYIYLELTCGSETLTTSYTGKVLPRRLSLSTTTPVAGGSFNLASNVSDPWVAEEILYSYEFFTTATANPADGSKAVVKSGTLKSDISNSRRDNLYQSKMAYTVKPADIDKYLHLTISISGQTYTLSSTKAVAKNNFTINGNAAVGQELTLAGNSVAPYYTPGMRYEWRSKGTRVGAPAASDKVLASGLVADVNDTNLVPVSPYRLTDDEVKQYVYLKLITLSGAEYYSNNLKGPVTKATQLTGTLTVTGVPLEGEVLTANATLTDVDPGLVTSTNTDLSMEWYYVTSGGYTSQITDATLIEGWTLKIPARYVGRQIFAVLRSNNPALYYGTVTSLRTPVIEGKYASAKTGLYALRAELINEKLPVGFDLTASGTDLGRREDLKFKVTLIGSKTTLNPGEEFILYGPYDSYYGTVEGTASPFTVTFKDVELDGGYNDLWMGLNFVEYDTTVTPPTIKSESEFTDNSGNDITHEVLVEAVEEINIEVLNNTDVELKAGTSHQIRIDTDAPITGKTFAFKDPAPTGLTVDNNGLITADAAAVAGTTGDIQIVVVNADTRQMGTDDIITVTVVTTPTPVTGVTINYFNTNWQNKTMLKASLERLMVGYETDPSQSITLRTNTARLGAEVDPSWASSWELEWTSSKPEAVSIDALTGELEVKQGGVEVEIKVTVKGSSPEISDSITFTTAEANYVPQSIVWGTKTIKMIEQEERLLKDLKVLFKVDGKYNRTIKLGNSMFTFSGYDASILDVDDSGEIYARRDGKTSLTITLTGTTVSMTVPVEVSEAKYASLEFTAGANNRYAKVWADSKGVLRSYGSPLVLYAGTDVDATKLNHSLANAVAGIIAPKYYNDIMERPADLGSLQLKLSKKYKVNVPTDYSITLPNKQKMVLTVIVASTQPEFVEATTVYNELEAQAAVQFKLYPGTRIKEISLESKNNVIRQESWSQTGDNLTIWVSVKNKEKAGKVPTTFKFTAYDLVNSASPTVDTSVKATLKVAKLPKASMAAIYVTGPAMYKEGYVEDYSSVYKVRYYDLINMNNLDLSTGKAEAYREDLPEYTDVLGQFINGVTTEYTAISTKNKKAPQLVIRDNQLAVATGTDLTTLPNGKYTYSLEYNYASKSSGLKTASGKVNVVVNVSGFTIDEKTLNIQMVKGTVDDDNKPVAQSVTFKLYNPQYQNNIKSSTWSKAIDQRYNGIYWDNDSLYQLVKKDGTPVQGVEVVRDSSPSTSDKNGYYRWLTLKVYSDSELLDTATHKAGTYNLLLHEGLADTTFHNPVTIKFTPAIKVNAKAPAIKVGKVTAFNQLYFGYQETEVALTSNPVNFLTGSNGEKELDWVMTNGPQMNSPFAITLKTNGNLEIKPSRHYTGVNINQQPAVGTYKYDLTIKNGLGLTSKVFKLSVKVSKAVSDVTVSAKMSGSVNPYQYSVLSELGIAKITFTCNIPNLKINTVSYQIHAIAKKASGGLLDDNQSVRFNTLNGKDLPGGGREQWIGAQYGQRYYSDRSYVPTDVKVTLANGQVAKFARLSPISIKDVLKDKTYDGYSYYYNTAYGYTSNSLNLAEDLDYIYLYHNNSFNTATPKYDPFAFGNAVVNTAPDKTNSLYKLVNGNYVPVDSGDIEWFDTITLTGAGAKNFEVYYAGSSDIYLEPISAAGRKAGTHKLTFSVIPTNSSSTVKRQVVDYNGNALYYLDENFAGKEKYVKYTVDIPKPVTMTMTLRTFYDYKLPPPDVQ